MQKYVNIGIGGPIGIRTIQLLTSSGGSARHSGFKPLWMALSGNQFASEVVRALALDSNNMRELIKHSLRKVWRLLYRNFCTSDS
jgi:hypothetical protein